MIPSDVAAEARTWVGVPFLHQGRSRSGVDCIGFVASVSAALGSRVFMDALPSNYARAAQARLVDGLAMHTRQIPLQVGAVVLIKWPFEEHASHAAIYTGESLIHCYEAERSVIEHGYSIPWPHRTTSVWAMPGVTYL